MSLEILRLSEDHSCSATIKVSFVLAPPASILSITHAQYITSRRLILDYLGDPLVCVDAGEDGALARDVNDRSSLGGNTEGEGLETVLDLQRLLEFVGAGAKGGKFRVE